MAQYLQPNVDQYALGGYRFFRMCQKLASPGDIFESTQGAQAFALGPDSDISEVNVAYLDTQVPNYLSKITVTPSRSFQGEITAFNETKLYAPSKNPGRILIWPTEIYDSTFLPPGFNEETDGLVREEPVIDILQYFTPQPGVTSVRADKRYKYESMPFKAGGILCYVLIPYYGRRYCSIAIQNLSRDNDSEPDAVLGKINVQVSGINFRIMDPATATPNYVPLNFLQTLNDNAGEGGAVGNARSMMIGTGYNQQLARVYDVANTDPPDQTTIQYQGGLFDYLLIELGQGAVSPPDITDCALTIVTSDVVGRTGL